MSKPSEDAMRKDTEGEMLGSKAAKRIRKLEDRLDSLLERVRLLEERQPIINGKRWNGEDWEEYDG